MNQPELFSNPNEGKKCKTCKHKDYKEYGYHSTKRFYYCTQIKDNKTTNGLKKIKANHPACGLYEKE